MKTDVAPKAPSCLGLPKPDGARAAEDHARKLARIEAALERIEAGRYGFCLTCEGRIALTRLEADPAEAICSTCDGSEGA